MIYNLPKVTKRGPRDQRNLRTRDQRNDTQNEATFRETWDSFRNLKDKFNNLQAKLSDLQVKKKDSVVT